MGSAIAQLSNPVTRALFNKGAIDLILLIHENPGIILSELISKSRMSERTVSLRLSDLIHSSFVFEERGQNNRRKLHLTPKGEKVAELLQQAVVLAAGLSA